MTKPNLFFKALVGTLLHTILWYWRLKHKPKSLFQVQDSVDILSVHCMRQRKKERKMRTNKFMCKHELYTEARMRTTYMRWETRWTKWQNQSLMTESSFRVGTFPIRYKSIKFSIDNLYSVSQLSTLFHKPSNHIYCECNCWGFWLLMTIDYWWLDELTELQ